MMEKNVKIAKPVKWLSSDFASFSIAHNEIVQLYDKRILLLFSEAKLIEISLLNN